MPHAQEVGFCRECGQHAGTEEEELARREGPEKALKRSEERSEVLATVGPVELASFAPVGRLVATDESSASGVLTELIQSIRLKTQAALETAALAAPLLLSLRLPSTLRRAQSGWAERSELSGLLGRLSRSRPPEVLLGRATLRRGA